MKTRHVVFFLAISIFLGGFGVSSAAELPFSENVDAMNEATESIVLLSMYDDEDNEIATASGFFAFDSMTVVTNYHAIEGAYSITAFDENDRSFGIPLLYGYDKEKDIAILRLLQPADCRPLQLADSGQVRKGEKVVAIGSPLGLMNTLSTGIVSGIDDSANYREFLFTAPISSGSSGGALFNDRGEVIGMTSASFVDGQNLNCAIASNEIAELITLPPFVETIREHYQQTQAAQIKTIHPGILTIAITADFYPYQYMNDQGKLVGIEIEIIEAIAERISLEVAYVILPFDDAFFSLGKLTDIAVIGCSYTSEREKAFRLSVPYAMINDEYGPPFAPVFCVEKQNSNLIETVNKQIFALRSDGSINRILKKYLPD